MAWSLDWFAAEALAKAGSQIRRASWTTKALIKQGPLWFLVSGGAQTLVQVTDFGADEFNARDWTDQPLTADVCGATPAYNTTPVAYGQWTTAPIQLPPPVPGFPSS
jgi:hypothetical protein